MSCWLQLVLREKYRCLTGKFVAGSVSAEAVHLMALYEAPMDSHASACPESRVSYSFAFLDAAAGRFYVGVTDDDAGRSMLGALLNQACLQY